MDSSGPSPNIFIYDASAGSGKTFTLVREYLTELLISKNPSFFRHILAITFTNKATAEMKNRIISTLIELSWIEPKDPPAMLEELIESTGLDRSKIKSRARSILEHLLRNYGMFSVETIDSFNHRLLRTFASDLKLPGQFEVSLDTEDLLLMAVDRLIDKVGEERVLTDLLIEFALEKTESDKSWDVGYDLFNSSKILVKDKEQESLESLLSNSLTELLEYRQALLERVAGLRRLIQANGEGIMEMFRQKDIERLNFTRGYIFDFYQKLVEGKIDMNLQTKWLQNLESQDPYTTKQKQEIKDRVDELMPDIISTYRTTQPLILELRFLENILSNFIPIAVLKLIDNEIEGLEEELQILPIYKFNRLIGSKIKDQPSPFIYERLGERYRKFMIDEFQDTSFLQWQNLIPLIENALSQQYTDGTLGQLTLVGDAKQSIYRWRGGLPEQFIELDQTNIPFQGATVQMSHLPKNYRSRDQIIDFNNGFFTHTSRFLSNMAYQELYRSGNQQESNRRPGGCVRIGFLDSKQKASEKDPIYLEEVFQEIQAFRDQGYSWNEICVLTRKKDQGIKVSSFLMEQGIPIVSGESLLLKSSKEVEMLINLLRVAINPNNKQAKFEALSYLSDGLESHADKHQFVLDGLETDGSGLENLLQENGINLPWVSMSELPLFEFFQACISGLQLALTSDAFTIEFMEMVWAFSVRPPNGKMDFLDHWENGKEKFSLNSSVGSDAVQIMTIHKSKGLEFPIVIFPWADMKIEDYRDHKIWVPNPLPHESIDQILIKFNKGIKEYSEEIAEIYDQEIAKAQLDNLNLVYVALTRAIDQLSIITEDHGPMKDRPSYTGEYFRDYLVSQGLWEDHKQWFQIGQAARESIPSVKTSVPEADIKVPSGGLLFDRIHLASGRAKLWNTETEASIRWGNLVHDTLSRIETQADLNLALDFAEQEYKLDRQEINILKDHILRVIHHDELVHFFDGGDEILNEREIYTAAGHSLRPDRVNIHKEKYVSIIDYKTGSPDKNHRDQVREYGKALEEIGFKVRERIVIYTNSEGVLINKE